MKYQWLQQAKTCEQLSQELGIKVKSITVGHIITAYVPDETGLIPITQPGVEIELDATLSPSQLNKLDSMFPGFKR